MENRAVVSKIVHCKIIEHWIYTLQCVYPKSLVIFTSVTL